MWCTSVQAKPHEILKYQWNVCASLKIVPENSELVSNDENVPKKITYGHESYVHGYDPVTVEAPIQTAVVKLSEQCQVDVDIMKRLAAQICQILKNISLKY